MNKKLISLALVPFLCAAALPSAASVIDGHIAYADKDYAKAFAEFSKAVAARDKAAKAKLAALFYLGEGTAQDLATGTRLFRECAEEGDTRCYPFVADALIKGRGTPRNLPEGRVWARKADFAGHAIGRRLRIYQGFTKGIHSRDACGGNGCLSASSKGGRAGI